MRAHFVDDYLHALWRRRRPVIIGASLGWSRATASPFGVRVLATLAGNEPMSIGRLAQITTIKRTHRSRHARRDEAKARPSASRTTATGRITLGANHVDRHTDGVALITLRRDTSSACRKALRAC